MVQSAAQLGVGAWRAAVLLELSVGKLRAAAAFLRTGILLGRVVSPLGPGCSRALLAFSFLGNTCSSMVPCAAPALLPPPCGASCSL